MSCTVYICYQKGHQEFWLEINRNLGIKTVIISEKIWLEKFLDTLVMPFWFPQTQDQISAYALLGG